jgi:hypothetical protein
MSIVANRTHTSVFATSDAATQTVARMPNAPANQRCSRRPKAHFTASSTAPSTSVVRKAME